MSFDRCKSEIKSKPKKWLVTGAAGFIGSNLVESLLQLGQEVVGVDNFSTGKKGNIQEVSDTNSNSTRFTFYEGDIVDIEVCKKVTKGVDIVLHQAALGSVPRSIEDPISTHRSNCDGFVNILLAAKDNGVGRFVFASSSSVYGDEPSSSKIEDRIGSPLSPYAATKLINEIYATAFSNVYDISCIGLRYFNVFGKRQDPEGVYAAVIPRWITKLLSGERCTIYGDGSTSRDFCYIDNVIQANILAGVSTERSTLNTVYNVGCAETTDLNRLFELVVEKVAKISKIAYPDPQYESFRKGDVKFSLADVSKIGRALGYKPTHNLSQGLDQCIGWYLLQSTNCLEKTFPGRTN